MDYARVCSVGMGVCISAKATINRLIASTHTTLVYTMMMMQLTVTEGSALDSVRHNSVIIFRWTEVRCSRTHKGRVDPPLELQTQHPTHIRRWSAVGLHCLIYWLLTHTHYFPMCVRVCVFAQSWRGGVRACSTTTTRTHLCVPYGMCGTRSHLRIPVTGRPAEEEHMTWIVELWLRVFIQICRRFLVRKRATRMCVGLAAAAAILSIWHWLFCSFNAAMRTTTKKQQHETHIAILKHSA